MLKFHNTDFHYERSGPSHQTLPRSLSKTAFDTSVAVILLVPMIIFALALLILNPVCNPGPLLFRQQRMGQGCQPFTAIKFRTMAPDAAVQRGAFDALEAERISRLGKLLRKLRIDELPQIINVLRGEMSMIGPRPDSYAHAQVYLQQVPGYAMRHCVMPGISGFAQVSVGYVDGFDDIKRKVDADRYYIRHACFQFDLWITWRTICVVLGARGC